MGKSILNPTFKKLVTQKEIVETGKAWHQTVLNFPKFRAAFLLL